MVLQHSSSSCIILTESSHCGVIGCSVWWRLTIQQVIAWMTTSRRRELKTSEWKQIIMGEVLYGDRSFHIRFRPDLRGNRRFYRVLGWSLTQKVFLSFWYNIDMIFKKLLPFFNLKINIVRFKSKSNRFAQDIRRQNLCKYFYLSTIVRCRSIFSAATSTHPYI